MATKPDEYKRHVSLRVLVETSRVVEKKYGRKEDSSIGEAFIRALENSVRNVVLTSKDLKQIANEVNKKKEKRHAK